MSDIGKTYEVVCPFIVSTHSDFDGSESEMWIPSARWENTACNQDVEAIADGKGLMLLTVVSRHKPSPKYAERVFFIRQWRDPDGKVFGQTSLKCLTNEAFIRRCRGWFYEWRLVGETVDA